MGSKGNSLSDSHVGKWLPQLMPFLLTAAAYMTHFNELDQSVYQSLYSPDVPEPSLWTAFLKCCPVLCLIMFVVSYEESGTNDNDTQDSNNKLRYKGLIAAGLALGCIGDGCLVFPSTFVCGMVSFAAGHVLYIYAYGLQPIKTGLGFFLFAICSCLLIYVRDMVDDEFIKGAMPFYSVFLVAMAWRALARMNENIWSKVRGLGGVLFLISDFLLVLQFGIHIPYGEMIVLGTYFSSQMCAALSILDPSFETRKD